MKMESQKLTFRRTCHLINSDIRRALMLKRTKPTFLNMAFSFFSPSNMLVWLYRVQCYFFHNHMYVISKLIMLINILFFSSEIHSRSRIDEGFVIIQPYGVLIHDQTIIGKNCTIMHQVSIGIKEQKDIPLKKIYSFLEDNILIKSGARIIGPCKIGKNSCIEMNAVVTSSIPSFSMAAGIPAKSINTINNIMEINTSVYPDFRREKHIGIIETLEHIREDLKNRCHTDGKNFSRFVYFKTIFNPAALTVIIFRFAHWLYEIGFRWPATFLTAVNCILFKTRIEPGARIKGGLVLIHATGVFISERTRIGRNVVFFHFNSVGMEPTFRSSPCDCEVSIGDNVFVGLGARIHRGVKIADNCFIAMNAVVEKTIPVNSVAAGIPAKVIKSLPSDWESNIITKINAEVAHPKNKEKFRHMLDVIKKDISFRADVENKKCNLFFYFCVFFNPAAMAGVIFRCCHWFSASGMSLPTKILYTLNKILFSVEIQPKAKIGPGLFLAHANGILIHNNTTIGRNCIFTLQNGVTVGPRLDHDPVNDRATIGDHVFVGMGANIFGNIRIGDNSVIGANAVVTKDAPSKALLVGIPAVNKAIHQPSYKKAV